MTLARNFFCQKWWGKCPSLTHPHTPSPTPTPIIFRKSHQGASDNSERFSSEMAAKFELMFNILNCRILVTFFPSKTLKVYCKCANHMPVITHVDRHKGALTCAVRTRILDVHWPLVHTMSEAIAQCSLLKETSVCTGMRTSLTHRNGTFQN